MNLGTAITILIVGGLLFLALRSIVRDWRGGNSKCSGCSGSCHSASCHTCSATEEMARRLDAIE